MPKLATLTLLFILIILVIEVGLHFLIRHLRKNFQWLITAQDKLPKFSTAMLDKFFAHGFDSELGWTRKPNTEAQESSGTVNVSSTHFLDTLSHHSNLTNG